LEGWGVWMWWRGFECIEYMCDIEIEGMTSCGWFEV
jgi:hypothetical protein